MFITVSGGQRIFFDVVGEKLTLDGPRMREKPTLIVMHGGPGFDHSGLRGDFDRFSDIAQVVYFDHRGNGRSVPSDPATWTLAQWGDDVRDLCEALGIEKPIVFGQSFGGMVAQSYATRHPDHPRAVILSSTAARMDFTTSLSLFERKGGAVAKAVAERFWTSGNDEEFAEYMRVCMPLYNTATRADGGNIRINALQRLGGPTIPPFLEAQLSGVPVVTSAVGGAPETLDPSGISGHAVVGDDPKTYADAIERTLVGGAVRERLRQELPGLVMQRFSIERMIAETVAVYGQEGR